MKIVIVGASTGLGRCTGIALAQRGADVALLARREALIVEAAKEAGPGTVAITCDVTDEAACRAAIDEAASALGGIDAVIYASGIGVLSRIEDLDADTWNRAFATNVTGASIVTAAALPYLAASHGSIVYLSSVSASMTAPWPGLGCYIVTKAALDKLVEVWRAEHSNVGFTRIIVGDCVGGDGDATSHLTDGWNHELMGEMFTTWAARGLLSESLIDIDHLVDLIDAVLRTGASATIPSIAITPRRPQEIS